MKKVAWGFFGKLGATIAGLVLAIGFGPSHAATPGEPIELASLAAQARLFEEPLIPTAPTAAEEDQDLVAAITHYRAAPHVDDVSALEVFLTQHPDSGWRLALLTNIGLSDYRYGYFSKAIAAFSEAWSAGRGLTDSRAKALADRAEGELLLMHARLGHADELQSLLDQLGTDQLSGRATAILTGAREGLWTMRHDYGVAYLCGPMALKNLLLALGHPADQLRFLDDYRSGPHGVSLGEVAHLADQAKLDYRIVYRQPGQPVPVPSLVHWKVNHFAAIVGEASGRYRIADPTFGGSLWITRAAVDSEGSGYFLVPDPKPESVWRTAQASELTQVYGMGITSLRDLLKTLLSALWCQDCAKQQGANGMTRYAFNEMLTSLALQDTPVGYTPPKGPSMKVTLTYNQAEASQPSTFSFYNVSQKWSLNWLTYIQDDPTMVGVSNNSVTRVSAGGGAYDETGFSTGSQTFVSEEDTGAVLSLLSANPIRYQRSLPDGSIEIYAASNGATAAPRLVFLSEVIDPAGNTAVLNYDNQTRLTSVVDATGRATTFSYGNKTYPLQITKISDPFGRSAALSYDGSGRLAQIKDELGLTSQFTYDSSSQINVLTTPYGSTVFRYGASSATSSYLQASDPLGYTERVEFQQQAPGIPFKDSAVPSGIIAPFNEYLYGRDTFYWDKHAYAVARGDYTKARNRHWAHLAQNTSSTSDVLESVQYPLESRIWYNYPGQTGSLGAGASGTLDKPTNTARLLDDGSTQLTQMQYNGAANPTSIVDPVGRTTSLIYAPNQIDVTSVQQVIASGPVTIGSFTYNSQHLPLTYTDAAGQTTHYAYNAAGQITAVTDPLGETTSYNYDPLGYLTSIVNANGKTAASYTYDTYGRVATATDSEGWTVAFSYDALDRLRVETFLDGTTRQYGYTNLDLTSVTDRQGRTTTAKYDAVRNLTSITDPLGNVTQFGYYENSTPRTLTDPNGNVTSWNIDLESRVTGKTYADGRGVTNTYEASTSRLHAVTDALGQTKQYTYLPDNRLSLIQYLNAINTTPSVALGYDPYFPRLTSMIDGSGATSYAYQPVGAPGALKLALESPPFANSAIAYQYDALGRVKTRSVGGDIETLAYDAIGRVVSHEDDLGTFQRTYRGQTEQITQQSSGMLGTRWHYDSNLNDRRLLDISNSPAGSHFAYTTTPENDITAIAESFSRQTWSYVYDAADRLKSAISSLGPTYKYGYDAVSNLGPIQTPTTTIAIVSNSLNQIAQAGGVAFSYDANGNLLSDYARTYAWDAENRLIGIGYPAKPGVFTSIRYDGLGRRIAIDEGSGDAVTGETRYGWCGETLCQARAANDAPAKRYFAEGEADFGNNLSLYYGVDQLGSVRDVIETSSGLRAAHFDYQPYGSPSTTLGSALAWTDFRYAGLFYHSESGLYMANYRTYDATVGRWLARDLLPENGGINLHEFVNSHPITAEDPLGLNTFSIGGSVSFEIGPIGFNFSAGYVVDSYGNFGSYYVGGLGGGVGAQASAGFSVSESNAKTICNLRGPFLNATGGGGVGVDLNFDTYSGPSSNGQVTGVGFTLGGGIGASGSIGTSYTIIHPITSLGF